MGDWLPSKHSKQLYNIYTTLTYMCTVYATCEYIIILISVNISCTILSQQGKWQGMVTITTQCYVIYYSLFTEIVS